MKTSTLQQILINIVLYFTAIVFLFSCGGNFSIKPVKETSDPDTIASAISQIEPSDTMPNTPEQAGRKQIKIDEFNKAEETSDFDHLIELKTADNISDFTPKHWTVSGTAYGDLDGVNGNEAAVVYLTSIGGEFGLAHCLAIFKKEGGKWALWYQSFSPILNSGSGGMEGNPFDGISIERRCIVIKHFGGSRYKWGYTHRYRFQNDNWYLVGAFSSYDVPYEYHITLDYNLLTGDAVVSYKCEECEEGVMPTVKPWTEKMNIKDTLPLMDKFILGENKLRVTNKNKIVYY